MPQAPCHGNTAMFGYRCGPPSQWPSQRPAYVTAATTTAPFLLGPINTGASQPAHHLRGFEAFKRKGCSEARGARAGRWVAAHH